MTAFDSSVPTEHSDVPTEHSEPSDGQDVTVTVQWHDRVAVLTVSGEIDMVTAPRFEEALSSALGDLPETLVVDLTEVDFFASAGLSALVAASQQAGERTGLCVVATNSATVRPLRVTALDRKIPVYDSVQQVFAAG